MELQTIDWIAALVVGLGSLLLGVDFLRRLRIRAEAAPESSAEEAARRTRDVVESAQAEEARRREAREAQVRAAVDPDATADEFDRLADMINADPDLN